MPFDVEEASVEDAAEIAQVLISSGTSSFFRLQLGSIDPASLNVGMTEKIAEDMRKEDRVYVVARDQETGKIMSYAQWILPKEKDEVVTEQDPEVSL